MTRVVRPGAPSCKAAAPKAAAETVPVEKPRVDKHVVAEPSAAPTPSAPSVPAREKSANINARSKAEPEPAVPQIGVQVPRRRTPHVSRLVDGNINYLRIGGLYLDRALAVLTVGRHNLLRRRSQPAVRPGPRAHSLHRAHDIGLLGEEGVPKVGGPTDIAAEQPQRVRKCHQRLDARIPALLPGPVHQLPALKIRVLLKPLLRLDDLKRIGARGQRLA